jgi:hypothetical protein
MLTRCDEDEDRPEDEDFDADFDADFDSDFDFEGDRVGLLVAELDGLESLLLLPSGELLAAPPAPDDPAAEEPAALGPAPRTALPVGDR